MKMNYYKGDQKWCITHECFVNPHVGNEKEHQKCEVQNLKEEKCKKCVTGNNGLCINCGRK
jgi:hypothetical protein